MSFLSKIFSWWNGSTIGTDLFTWHRGERMGEDGAGNVYYRERGGDRRWVIYNGYADASRVPPDWHNWLHHTTDTAPSEVAYEPKEWQKPHRPNMTGTSEAWRPPGSVLTPSRRPTATGDYDPWTPA